MPTFSSNFEPTVNTTAGQGTTGSEPQAEARLLQGIMRAIANTQALDLLLSVTLQHICQSMGWVFAEAWVPDAAQTRLECSAAWYSSETDRQTFRAASEKAVFAIGEGLPGRVWLHKQPEWIPDITRSPDPEFLRVDLAQAAQLKAALAVPVLAQETFIATIVFFLAAPRPEDEVAVRVVSGIAAQLGSLMQHRQAEAACEQNQRRLSTLINSLPGIVFTGGNDPAWTMLYLSDGCLPITGYRSEALAGRHRQLAYNDICHPADLPILLRLIDQAIAHREPYEVEYRIYTKAGQEKWLWEKGHGLYSASGEVLGIEGFITDITALKHAEKALRAR